MLTISSPPPNSTFRINSQAVFPAIDVVTAGGAPTAGYEWSWDASWTSRTGRQFTASGGFSTQDSSWRVDIGVLGGTLTVTVKVVGSSDSATVTMTILGDQPSEHEVTTYLATLTNAVGFDAILRQETHFRHFDAGSNPTTAGDNGYGICQLTNPRPTYEQVWSWKRNIDAGVALYQRKQLEAIRFLTQSGRTHTTDQLRAETVSRWNGGAFHQWDATAGAWVPRTDVLCDPQTGNFGWSLNNAANQGMTLDQLRDRDFPLNARGRRTYRLPAAGDNFGNFGVCYARRVLGL